MHGTYTVASSHLLHSVFSPAGYSKVMPKGVTAVLCYETITRIWLGGGERGTLDLSHEGFWTNQIGCEMNATSQSINHP